MSTPRVYRIGVIGAGVCDETIGRMAEEVGHHIGRRGGLLLCGGLGGVMEAAARGAKKAGGTTIGILPGENARDANPHIDIPIVTGMGEARNVIIVRTADAVIAISGGPGTLSEIAFCLKLGVPLVGLKTWDIGSSMHHVATASEAVDLVYRLLEKR
ncbi:MAG: TIGR00725 family protein [Gemmatimonadota bacterium]|nr:MAG: TIGR00725 family protein [Gemmatimonadota bacterium]